MAAIITACLCLTLLAPFLLTISGECPHDPPCCCLSFCLVSHPHSVVSPTIAPRLLSLPIPFTPIWGNLACELRILTMPKREKAQNVTRIAAVSSGSTLRCQRSPDPVHWVLHCGACECMVWGLCGTTNLRSEFQALDSLLCSRKNALPRYNLRGAVAR